MDINLQLQQHEAIRWVSDMLPKSYDDSNVFENLSRVNGNSFKFPVDGQPITVTFTNETVSVVIPDFLPKQFPADDSLHESLDSVIEHYTAFAIDRANSFFHSIPISAQSHKYVNDKQSYLADGVKVDNGLMVIPIYQSFDDWRSGHLTSYQYINNVGVKIFPKSVTSRADYYDNGGAPRVHVSGPVGGGFFPLEFTEHPFTIFITEGYVTGTSVCEATGCPVAVAFNAGNLLPVAKKVRAEYPMAKIIIAADRDPTGQLKAAVVTDHVHNSISIPPVFGAAWCDDETLTDFNDLKVAEGLDAVRRQLLPAVVSVNYTVDAGVYCGERKYLSKFHIDEFQKTRIVLTAPMGSGKTYSIMNSNIKELVLDKGKYLAIVVPRVSLVDYYASLLQKIGLPAKHYNDGITEKDRVVVICVNSFAQLPSSWSVADTILVVDESESAYDQLMMMRTPAGRSLQDAYLRLASFIAGAHCVINCDANTSSLTLDIMSRNSGHLPLNLVDFEYQAYRGQYMIELPSEAAAFNKILSVLQKGGRVLCATSSKKVCLRVRELGSLAGLSEKKMMVVYRENKNNPEQQSFLKDVNGEMGNYDLVAYSPVISGGLSFEDNDKFKPFDLVIGIFKSRQHSSLPNDWVQQLARHRRPTNMWVFLDTPTMWCPLRSDIISSMSINTGELPNLVTEKLAAELAQERNWPVGNTMAAAINHVMVKNNSFLGDKVGVMMSGDIARSTAREVFTRLVTKMGFIFIKDELTNKIDGKELLAEVKGVAEERRVEGIVNAEPVSKAEAVKIMQSYDATESEICSALRRNLQDFYDIENVTPGLVALDDDGELRRKVRKALIATADNSELALKEARSIALLVDGELDALTVRSAGLQNSVFGKVLEYAGYVVTEERTFEWSGVVDVAGFVKYVGTNKKKVGGVSTVREDYKSNPIQLMNNILGKMGLQLACVSSKQKGVKVRKYIANNQQLAILNKIILQQIAKNVNMSD
ncbi:MAG: hypothetical protein BWK79_04935 [Beggiatoa sp. IS2]|nr:MAG: hypothetical protein BWK79_04935 [Beggiatoa sp. IS2]